MRIVLLVVLLAAAVRGPSLGTELGRDGPVMLAAAKTGKERLGEKASDEQRVNDCKVPEARRTRARPASCR